MLKFLGIIPARYASTRFPAKPLAMLGGKTVIQRVYEQVAGILDDAYVATDDERIEEAVKAFGGKVVMTSVNHKSGTDRCYEAYTKIGGDFDVVVNIQGDEPFIQPSQLETVKACFNDITTQIATLVKPFTPENGFEALENINSPKVVLTARMALTVKTARMVLTAKMARMASTAKTVKMARMVKMVLTAKTVNTIILTLKPDALIFIKMAN